LGECDALTRAGESGVCLSFLSSNSSIRNHNRDHHRDPYLSAEVGAFVAVASPGSPITRDVLSTNQIRYTPRGMSSGCEGLPRGRVTVAD